MSEPVFGEIITGKQERDAVHVPVMPADAGEILEPGQHVGLLKDGRFGTVEKPIGIVDPFMRHDVQQGQTFWLWLYPKTITSLRHHWYHPAIDGDIKKKEESMAWLENFASGLGISTQELIDGMDQNIKTGDYIHLGVDSPVYDHDELWKHYRIATGKKVSIKKQAQIGLFSCSC